MVDVVTAKAAGGIMPADSNETSDGDDYADQDTGSSYEQGGVCSSVCLFSGASGKQCKNDCKTAKDKCTVQTTNRYNTENGTDQGFVDFSLRENAVKTLIPEFKDPGGAVCVAEIRVGVVNADPFLNLTHSVL